MNKRYSIGSSEEGGHRLGLEVGAAVRHESKRFGLYVRFCYVFFFQAEDGIRDRDVTGVQTCALPISTAAFALWLPGISASISSMQSSMQSRSSNSISRICSSAALTVSVSSS